MNKLDKSLEEFDIVKLLLFLLLFLAITLFMILALIVPNIKEHKQQKSLHSFERTTTLRVEELLRERESELQTLRGENRKVIEAFVERFDEAEFLRFAQAFFTQASLEKVAQTEHEEDFMRYELKVTSLLETPSKFYDFLEALNRYENIVKADFPIQMEAQEGLIYATFSIKVFELKP
jgi:NAD-dependent DNA ligase